MHISSNTDHVQRYGLLASLISLLLLGGLACQSKKGQGEGSGKTSQKLTALAAHTPSDVRFAVAIPSLKSIRTSYSGQWGKLKKAFGDENSGSQDKSGSFTTQENVSDLIANLDKIDLKKAGIQPTTPALGTIHEETALWMMNIKDKKAFSSFVKERFQGKQSQKKVDGRTIQILGPKGDRKVPIGWTYLDSTVAFGAPNQGNADKIAKQLTSFFEKRKDDKSLKGQAGFESFQRALVDSKSIAAYVSTSGKNKQYVEQLRKGLCGPTGPMASKSCQMMTDQLQGSGLAFRMPSDGHLQLRGWVGWTDKGTKWFEKSMKTSKTTDWTRFATDKTAASIRMALRPDVLWKDFKSGLKKEAKQELEASIQQMEKAAGGDMSFEKDVLGAFTGQGGMFLYEIGQPKGGPSAAMVTSKYLFAFQLTDKAKPASLLKSAKSMAGRQVPGTLKVQPLKVDGSKVQGVKVAQITDVPMPTDQFPKAYITDQFLVLASGALSNGEIRDLLKNKGKNKPITKAKDLKIGSNFTQNQHVTGLYLNATRLVSQLKQRFKGVPSSVWTYVDPLRELALMSQANKQGLMASLEARVNPDQIIERMKEMQSGQASKGGGGSQGMQLERVQESLNLDTKSIEKSRDLQKKKIDKKQLEQMENMQDMNLGK